VSPPVAAPQAVRAQYEALRREATAAAPDAPRGHGLALFLARGLPAWLAALSALTPAGPSPRGPDPAPGEPRAPLGPAVRQELTTVLAGMVLACTQPGDGGSGPCPHPAR
jgi:hypothetical protein